jgi:hypothetical protein
MVMAGYSGASLPGKLGIQAGARIKVCAVDETWSGLKLVIRKENR